jgi:hypothetical protein
MLPVAALREFSEPRPAGSVYVNCGNALVRGVPFFREDGFCLSRPRRYAVETAIRPTTGWIWPDREPLFCRPRKFDVQILDVAV